MNFPDVKAGVIYADPPWTQKTWSKKGLDGRPQHYDRMSLQDICDLPIHRIADKDCHLFLWTTSPHLQQAFKVIEAWGFQYSSVAFTWAKLRKNNQGIMFMAAQDFHVGMGYTTRKNCEFCLLARKGKPKRKSKAVHELLIAPLREHSRKPEEARIRIMEYADGPYVELFAREKHPEWISWGNETEKFKNG